jgi:hypothetical protein
MTALRQRLIEDMQVRNYSPRTVEAYVAAVAKLAKHFRRSPDQLSGEDVRVFQVHWLAQKVSWSQFNQIVSGLRFFFGTTLARPSTFCRWVHKESALRPVEQPAARGAFASSAAVAVAAFGPDRNVVRGNQACRADALSCLRQRAEGAWRVVAAIGSVHFCWRAAEGFDSRIDRRHVVIAETLAPVTNPTCRPALRAESRIGVGFFVVGHAPASAKSRIPAKIVDTSHDRRVNSTRRGIGAP